MTLHLAAFTVSFHFVLLFGGLIGAFDDCLAGFVGLPSLVQVCFVTCEAQLLVFLVNHWHGPRDMGV